MWKGRFSSDRTSVVEVAIAAYRRGWLLHKDDGRACCREHNRQTLGITSHAQGIGGVQIRKGKYWIPGGKGLLSSGFQCWFHPCLFVMQGSSALTLSHVHVPCMLDSMLSSYCWLESGLEGPSYLEGEGALMGAYKC